MSSEIRLSLTETSSSSVIPAEAGMTQVLQNFEFPKYQVKYYGYLYIKKLEALYFQNDIRFSNRELVTTDTEENAIASPAYSGFRLIPKNGYKTPAAMGIPITL